MPWKSSSDSRSSLLFLVYCLFLKLTSHCLSHKTVKTVNCKARLGCNASRIAHIVAPLLGFDTWGVEGRQAVCAQCMEYVYRRVLSRWTLFSGLQKILNQFSENSQIIDSTDPKVFPPLTDQLYSTENPSFH